MIDQACTALDATASPAGIFRRSTRDLSAGWRRCLACIWRGLEAEPGLLDRSAVQPNHRVSQVDRVHSPECFKGARATVRIVRVLPKVLLAPIAVFVMQCEVSSAYAGRVERWPKRLACMSADDANKLILSSNLKRPWAEIKKFLTDVPGELIGIRLCRSEDLVLYAVTFLTPSGFVDKQFINASSGNKVRSKCRVGPTGLPAGLRAVPRSRATGASEVSPIRGGPCCCWSR